MNMALVLAMAKRQRAVNVELEELIAEGYMALLRCVDRFDVSYGFKFSTYACRAILKSFYRLSSKAVLHHQRFPVGYQPEFDRPDCEHPRLDTDWEDSMTYVKKVLARTAPTSTTWNAPSSPSGSRWTNGPRARPSARSPRSPA